MDHEEEEANASSSGDEKRPRDDEEVEVAASITDATTTAKKKKKKNKVSKRVRAHTNPYTPPQRPPPASPDSVEWSTVFADWQGGNSSVEIADIGCGFGGLIHALGPLFPDKYIVGMEIRESAVEYVRTKLADWRKTEKGLDRVGVLAVNCMKHLPNYFRKGQLQRMYFLYADPHFKKSNWDRRIISINLLDVYAYFIAVGGTIYTVTDVEDLHKWEADALDRHPLFRRATAEEIQQDPTIPIMLDCTNDAQKAKREGRGQWYTVHKRIDPRLLSLK